MLCKLYLACFSSRPEISKVMQSVSLSIATVCRLCGSRSRDRAATPLVQCRANSNNRACASPNRASAGFALPHAASRPTGNSGSCRISSLETGAPVWSVRQATSDVGAETDTPDDTGFPADASVRSADFLNRTIRGDPAKHRHTAKSPDFSPNRAAAATQHQFGGRVPYSGTSGGPSGSST